MVAAGTVGVDVLGGRVVWMNSSGELPAQTHQALAVTGSTARPTA